MKTNKIVSNTGYNDSEQKSTVIDSEVDKKFQGFPPLEKDEKGKNVHFTMYPNGWNRALQKMEGNEIKVVWYIMEHTWGWQEDGEHVRTRRISTDEFMYGRKLTGSGKRIDEGTGLSENTVIASLKKATDHGYIFCEDDDSNPARKLKFYGLVMLEDKKTFDPQNLQSKGVSLGSSVDPQNLQSKGTSDPQKLRSIRSANVEDRMKQENITRKPLIQENITHFSEKEIENNNLAEKTIQFILKGKRNHKPITFTDIEGFLRRTIRVKGNDNVPYGNNVILWSWVSPQFVEIVEIVMAHEKIGIESGTIGFDYGKAKKYPHYPIAKPGTDYTDQETHWLPAIFVHKDSAPVISPKTSSKSPDLRPVC